jgi:hypothetical protein
MIRAPLWEALRATTRRIASPQALRRRIAAPGSKVRLRSSDLDKVTIQTFLQDRRRALSRPGSPLSPSWRLAADAAEDRQELVAEVAAQVLERLHSSRSQSAHDDSLVFVVCSFEPDMDPVFDAVACAAASVGLHAVRLKDVPGDYRLTEQILTLVRTARLVVADLSHERPNVYFELGYARALDKTVITIIRNGATAHVDVRDWVYLEYLDSRPLEQQLRERFRFEMSRGSLTSHIARPRTLG